jgi:hypothetical protein
VRALESQATGRPIIEHSGTQKINIALHAMQYKAKGNAMHALQSLCSMLRLLELIKNLPYLQTKSDKNY